MIYQDFPPALLTLSPRLTKAGDPSASVVGINTIPLPDGALVYCIEAQAPFRLNRQSTAAPDGNAVLAPTTGPGRWLIVASGGSAAQAAYGGVAAQGLPAGPYVKISTDATFGSWSPGDVVSIHFACSVNGLGDFPPFGVTIRPAVSLDDGATWQWIQFDPDTSIIAATATGDGSTSGSIDLTTAVACPSAPRVSLWNNGGGGIGASQVFACYRTQAAASPPPTSLVSM